MKHILIILLIGLLGGCGTIAVPQGDTIAVKWVQLPTQGDVIDACADTRVTNIGGTAIAAARRKTTYTNPFVNGCFRKDGNICVIITSKYNGIQDHDINRVVGHELRHCYEGYYHE